MADNRLFLKCLTCGSTLTIARLQAGMVSDWTPARVTDLEREHWLLTHSRCDEDFCGLNVTLDSENDRALKLSHLATT